MKIKEHNYFGKYQTTSLYFIDEVVLKNVFNRTLKITRFLYALLNQVLHFHKDFFSFVNLALS
jgi:hypothetical protein